MQIHIRSVDLAAKPRINLGSDWEIQRWAHQLGVTPDVVRRAVAAVGNRPEDVCQLVERSGQKGFLAPDVATATRLSIPG